MGLRAGHGGWRRALLRVEPQPARLKAIIEVPARSLVFCHPNGEPIGSFKKSFLALLKMAGVTHRADGRVRTPYPLRHIYATERLNAGVQEYHLAKNMGASVAMLEKHYGHTSNVGNIRELTKQRRGSGAVVDLEWLAS